MKLGHYKMDLILMIHLQQKPLRKMPKDLNYLEFCIYLYIITISIGQDANFKNKRANINRLNETAIPYILNGNIHISIKHC